MVFEQILSDWPYLAWAFGAAATFYMVTTFAVSHLHPDKKAHLSLWLQGDYESTWPEQFGAMFDSIFGADHLHLRCIILSSLASVAAVFALWLLFDHILGLISLRADTNLSLGQALLLGAAINIIPDYISLYETRWLLKQFERIRNPLVQALVLILDALITGVIIYIGVMVYQWITGEEPVSLVEMLALFSLYAIFFYSTFLTSIWAWAYCLSSWTSRLSSKLRGWLDVEFAPGKSLAIIGAAFVLAGTLAAKPILTMDDEGKTVVDEILCTAFPKSACHLVARLTKDEKERIEFLDQDCLGSRDEECLRAGLAKYYVRPNAAAIFWEKACKLGNTESCAKSGFLHHIGLGVKQSKRRATEFYERGCNGGSALACAGLGDLQSARPLRKRDTKIAANFYKQACILGNAKACFATGSNFQLGIGVAQDDVKAVTFFQRGCAAGNAPSCTSLGALHEYGFGVAKQALRAFDLYEQGCSGGDVAGCAFLAEMYEFGEVRQRSITRASSLYKRACSGGMHWACVWVQRIEDGRERSPASN